MLTMISSEVHSSHSKAALLPCSALDELLSLSLRKEPCQPICCFARRRKEKEEETRESRRRKCFKHPAGRLHWQVFHQYWGCKKETFFSVDSFQIPRKFHPSMVLWRSKNRPGKCQHTLTHQFVRFYRTQVRSLPCLVSHSVTGHCWILFKSFNVVRWISRTLPKKITFRDTMPLVRCSSGNVSNAERL